MLVNTDQRLTPIQRGMVFHQLIAPHAGFDIEQIVVTLDAPVDVDRLEAAWQACVASHRALHATVVESGRGEYRLVPVPGFRSALEEIDVSAGNGALPSDALLDDWLAQDRARGFDIFTDVPLRMAIVRLSGGAVRCVWTFHLILLDGRSFADVLVDVWDAYDALALGQSPQIPDRSSSAGFIDWLHGLDPAPSIAHWQNLLADVEPAMPFPVGSMPTATCQRVVERRLDENVAKSMERWTEANGVTLDALVQASWATVLSRHTGHGTVVFGAARTGRDGHVDGADRMLGAFATTVPVRAAMERLSGLDLVRQLCEQQSLSRAHEHVPPAQMHTALGDNAWFETLVVFNQEDLDSYIHRRRPGWVDRRFQLHEQTPYPVTLYAYARPSMMLRLEYLDGLFTPHQAARVLEHQVAILQGIVGEPTREARRLPMLTGDERDLIDNTNATRKSVEPTTITTAFSQAVALHPNQPALTGAGRTLSYAELDAASDAVAAMLAEHGIQPGEVVGLSIDRSLDLVIGMLGILKAGAAYLPLDPAYPDERLAFCVRDSGVRSVLTQRRYAERFQAAGARALVVEEWARCSGVPHARADGDDLAYCIYTSGSTGTPKGVQVTHANVVNLFAGMDAVIETGSDTAKRWLAVTSASFDISVLELLWTLTRGFEVVVHGARDLSQDGQRRGPSFSLFHFASGMDASDPQPYRLIIEAARFADSHGFEAIWSPERHFHDFGAPYPSPPVMSAALATITSRVQLRAGSVVLPLHDPLRVAEDWSLVDQLSNGRVGVSFASGWQPNDFVLAPANYDRRKALMFEQIETVRALWRGERIMARNPKGDEVLLGTFPRPVQTELPIWITAAGSPDTFRQAGSIGANVLTHMLGQTLRDLEVNIRTYREAREAAGHDPAAGQVTVMVHTFIDEDTDQVREVVRGPMQRYLRSAASLVGSYADSWAAFKRGAGSTVVPGAMSELTEDQQQELYDFAFERYFESSSLLGSVEKCARLVDALGNLGVDEIACLIDFGVAPDVVIAQLPYIERLKNAVSTDVEQDPEDVVRSIAAHSITHMQCTPSLASTIPVLTAGPDALVSLRQLLIGGEPLPPDLVAALHERLPATASIANMYGPTETTIWSTTQRVERDARRITIGRPIANTQCYVLDSLKQLLPPGCIGELHIAGKGVARGYHQRPELNAERFLDLDIAGQSRRMYATGDLVRQLEDGSIEYVGRNDFQVKLRGHRVELGEIEVALRAEAGVADAVVVAQAGTASSPMLVGYLVAARDGSPIEVEALKASLRRRVPDYMVPNNFVWLDGLPLTPNGKIDRNALSSAVSSPPRVQAEAMPRPHGEEEQIIRDVWQRVLNVADIGVRDNFFELGGHSILAISVQEELSHAFGTRLPIVELFRSPTIEALAAHFARTSASSPVDLPGAGAGVGKARKRRAVMDLRVGHTAARSHDVR